MASVVVAFSVGLLAGAVIFGGRGPDLAAAATAMRDGMRDSAGLLEVVGIEYEEALAAGPGSTEFQAAHSNLARSRERWSSVAGPLAQIDPARAAAISDGFDTLSSQIDTLAPLPDVQTTISTLRTALTGTT